MLIEDYFAHLQAQIAACALVDSFSVQYDKRGRHEGFIRGEIHFHDDSILHVREFVEVELGGERLMYVYHYVAASQQLIFRYDNTGHHRKLHLPTFPHHKHAGSEENIIASAEPTISQVLHEIEHLI